MKKAIIFLAVVAGAFIAGCGEPAPLPETKSAPKPASNVHNVFVRAVK